MSEDWEWAIDEAKEELGYDADWEDLVVEAKSRLSELAKSKHRKYLKSERWLKLREDVLKRDNRICQDCQKLIPEVLKLFNNISFKPLKVYINASQVHHIDYEYLGTVNEKDWCISLCGNCHRLRHTELSVSKKFLFKKIKENIFWKIYNKILKQDAYIQEALKHHREFVGSLTVKPRRWIQDELKKEKDSS